MTSYNVTPFTGLSTGGVGGEGPGDWTYRSLLAWQAGRWVLLVFRPLVAVLGVLGNALSVTVILASPLRQGPSAVYMVTLALQDLVLSVVGMVHVLPTEAVLGEAQVFRVSWHCRAFYFTLLFTAHWDTLTMVAMTAQRYVAIAYPLRAARWNTRRVAVVTISAAAAISFAANWAHLFLYTAHPYTGKYRSTCGVSGGAGEYWVRVIYPWLDWTLYSLLPILAIVLFNVLIHRALSRAEQLSVSLSAAHSHQHLASSSSVALSCGSVAARRDCALGPPGSGHEEKEVNDGEVERTDKDENKMGDEASLKDGHANGKDEDVNKISEKACLKHGHVERKDKDVNYMNQEAPCKTET